MTLKELAEKIGAEVVGNPSLEVFSANTLEEAQPGQISFLANPKYARQLQITHASAIVVAPDIHSDRTALLKIKDPYRGFMQSVVLLHGYRKHPHAGIHPRAYVDPDASVGEGTVLYPGAYVGPRARIGRDCILYPNVVVYDDCIVGDRVTLHAGTSIGHDGFGYATAGGVHHKIPQAGNAIVEDDVEMGANCSVDRATLGSTIIGRGTKFSNNVVIGHGAKVGAYNLYVAHVGIAGSTKIGHHVTMGGSAGMVGHIKIGDNVNIAAYSLVTHDVGDEMTMIGNPAMPASQGRRAMALFTHLPELRDRIKQLENELAELKKASRD